MPDTSVPPPATDAELVQRCRAGEAKAFDELVARYQRQAVAVSYRLLGNAQDALDVTQDSFLKAFAGLGMLETPAAFGGWLMRIVANLSLNYRRSRQRRAGLSLAECLVPTDGPGEDNVGSAWVAPGSDPSRTAEGNELGGRLKEAIDQLPEKQRLAIIMYTIEQLPQGQVAQAMGCSVEAVKWHVFQGRKRLRELLKDYL
jgi:RNA polymerase sigma-70 factor (ECF subfamily)